MMADLRGQLTGIAENIATLDTLMQGDEEAGDQLFSVLGIHVLAGREEPLHLPTLLSNAGICILVVSFCVCC